MSENIANYQAERHAFCELLQPECERRILLFEGKSGSGKSTLLRHCRTYISKESNYIPVDLRGTNLTVVSFLLRVTRLLRNEHFSAFDCKVAELSEQSTMELKHVAQWGNENQINVALQANNNLNREERLTALTHAWFLDMQAIQQQCVVMIDTFEQADNEMEEWVSGEFLTRVVDSENLRVIVAGQTVPDQSRIEWGHCSQKWTLFGVKDAKHWLPVVEALGRKIPSDQPFSFLQGICFAFEGNPAAIMRIIQNFPRNPQKEAVTHTTLG